MCSRKVKKIIIEMRTNILVKCEGFCKLQEQRNQYLSYGFSRNQFCHYISAAGGLVIHRMLFTLLSTESLSAFLFPTIKDSNT